MRAEQTRRAEKFSQQLRRGIAALSLIAVGSMSLISLSQMGIIKHLPEPPLPLLDADRVDASAEASSRFSTPGAKEGIGNLLAKDTSIGGTAQGIGRVCSRGGRGSCRSSHGSCSSTSNQTGNLPVFPQSSEGSGSQEPQTEQMRPCLGR